MAGPEPCTNACLWLAVAAGVRKLDPSGIADTVLRDQIADIWAAAALVPDDAHHREQRESPRTDSVGALAHLLRCYVCTKMKDSSDRWQASFAVDSLEAYHAKVDRMAVYAFADHQMLFELAERLAVKIVVVPRDHTWNLEEFAPTVVDPQREIILGNNDSHFVWLRLSNHPPVIPPGGVDPPVIPPGGVAHIRAGARRSWGAHVTDSWVVCRRKLRKLK